MGIFKTLTHSHTIFYKKNVQAPFLGHKERLLFADSAVSFEQKIFSLLFCCEVCESNGLTVNPL